MYELCHIVAHKLQRESWNRFTPPPWESFASCRLNKLLQAQTRSQLCDITPENFPFQAHRKVFGARSGETTLYTCFKLWCGFSNIFLFALISKGKTKSKETFPYSIRSSDQRKAAEKNFLYLRLTPARIWCEKASSSHSQLLGASGGTVPCNKCDKRSFLIASQQLYII